VRATVSADALLRAPVRGRTFRGVVNSLDTLEIAKRLRSAGFDDTQAEAITGALRDLRDADLSRLATKEDLAALRTELRSEMASLRFEMASLRSELSGEIKMVRSEMEILRRDLTIRLGGMIFVLGGFLVAIKFLG
jgi:ribosomal protein L29